MQIDLNKFVVILNMFALVNIDEVQHSLRIIIYVKIISKCLFQPLGLVTSLGV